MADSNESKEIIKISFDTNANAAARDVNNLNASIEQTTDNVDENTEAYKSFKTQLREANAELQKAVSIYGETSEQAIKAAKGVAELKDQIGFAKDLAENFNPDQKFKALGAATQVAATAMQGATAGMALFGDQSEATEKALLQVQAAMAFSDAISQLSDLGDQWALLKSTVSQNAIAQKANTAATGAAAIVQKVFAGSVDTTSTSFKVLKGAIAATGIGLLVTGVVALINNFDKVKEVILNLIPGLSGVADFIGGIVNTVTDFIGVTSEAERTLAKINERADETLAKNKKFLAEHESQLDEYTKQKIQIVNDYNEAIKESGANQVALYQEVQRKLSAVDKARQDEIDQRRKEEAEKAKATREKAEHERIEAEKKRADDEQKRIDEENKKRAEAFQAELDLLREQEEEKERAKLLIKEEAATNEVDLANIQFETLRTIRDEDDADKETRLQNDRANRAALVSNGEQLINNVKVLAGKNKAIQKAAIIADGSIALGKAAVNTAEAVTKDLAKGFPVSVPLVALDIAVGATSAAAIISSTSKALQAVGGGSISGSSAPSIPTGVNAQPQTGFQASSENQIATSFSNAQTAQPVIKTFVVAQDVSTQQGLDAAVVKQNSFGGTNP